MHDEATYAANRLQEIKADPAPWADPWAWRQEFSAADSPGLRREVVGLARQVGPEAFLAVLAQALASGDPLLRLDAARSIALLPDASLARGLAVGIAAPDAETRDEVMDLISQVQPSLRPDLLREGIAAADKGVQQRAVELLMEQPSPEFFAVLLEGLRTTSSDTRSSVGDAIASLVGEHFRDYDTASRWWAEHRPAFDSMMRRAE
jgi:HEAT repeat protein